MRRSIVVSVVILGLAIPGQAQQKLCLPLDGPELGRYVEGLKAWGSGSADDAARRVVDVHHEHHERHHYHPGIGPRTTFGRRRRADADANYVDHPWVRPVTTLVRYHDPRALVSIALLHAEVHALQIEDRRVQEAAETRQFLEPLLGEMARLGRTETAEVHQALARLWTRVALSLRDAGHFDDALGAFHQALALEPEDRYVLLTVAAVDEKRGRYRDAGYALERLLEHDPEHPEARLRLALVAARQGRDEAALDRLAALSRDAPDWIRAIAYQERVQLLVSRNDEAAARTLVREARGLFPDNPRLAVLELFLADDRSALLDELATASQGPRTEPTPRALYNRWPAGEDELRRAVERDAEAFAPFLAAALRTEGCL